MYMYNSFTLFYTRNQHNIVNQLYTNKNFKKKKKKPIMALICPPKLEKDNVKYKHSN